MATKTPIKRTTLQFITLMLLFPIYLLSQIIPKDKQLHIFGSSLGYHFADNSKYLFLYTSEHVKEIKSVFISKNQDVVDFLNNNGMTAEYLYSYAGFKTVLRAKKAFISHSVEDIHPILIGGAEIVQLWHGTPLKMIGYDADWISYSSIGNIKNFIKRILYTIFPYLYSSRVFDSIIISSDAISPSFKSAFNISESKISITGQPRNDALSPNYQFNIKYFPEIDTLEKLSSQYSHIISWLPTHRKPAPINIINLMNDYNFNINDFNETLSHLNAVLLLKPHFLELEILEEVINNQTNIQIYHHVDPYPLLNYTDILITDYSSIYFDYLVLNKPIIFAPFDMDEYLQNNVGFYYNYEKVTPGSKCYDWEEIKGEIKSIIDAKIAGEKDPYLESRIKVKKVFNKYEDNFSKRIVNRFFDTR